MYLTPLFTDSFVGFKHLCAKASILFTHFFGGTAASKNEGINNKTVFLIHSFNVLNGIN